jgi:hypothetical protein
MGQVADKVGWHTLHSHQCRHGPCPTFSIASNWSMNGVRQILGFTAAISVITRTGEWAYTASIGDGVLRWERAVSKGRP